MNAKIRDGVIIIIEANKAVSIHLEERDLETFFGGDQSGATHDTEI